MIGGRSIVVCALGTALGIGAIGSACAGYTSHDDATPDPLPDRSIDDEEGGVDGGTDVVEASVPRGQHLFSKSFGSAGHDYMTRAHVDVSGNLLVAGSFDTALDLGAGTMTSAGNNDIYFAKFDPTGKLVFGQHYGDAVGQSGVNIIGTGTSDIFATGAYNGTVRINGTDYAATDTEFDSFIVRLGGDGTYKESYVLAGPQFQFINGLAYDGSHGVIFTGYQSGSFTNPSTVATAGGYDVVLGHVISTTTWAKGFGDAANQVGNDIAYDPSGSVVAVGYFAGAIALGDGDPHASAGGQDAWIARFDVNGNTTWSKAFGGAGDQEATHVAIANGGEVVVGGSFAGTFTIASDLVSAGANDVFVTKLAANGTPKWSKRFGGSGDDALGGIAIAPNGDILVCGRAFGTLDLGLGDLPGAGDADVWIARLDPDGNPIWAKRFGDAAFQSANGIGLTLDGQVWLAGYFLGTIDLGGGPLTSVGKEDIYIARFAP